MLLEMLSVKINTADQLKSLSSSVGNYANSYFKLDADIDLAGSNFTAIGTFDNHFKGTYEGLFGKIEGATIQNVTVSNSITQNYYGNNRYVGGIAGYAKNSTFENCIVESGTITGNDSDCLGGNISSNNNNFASIVAFKIKRH